MLNLHIYPSPFTNESRILKITGTLRKQSVFERICVLALWKEGLPRQATLSEGVELVRVPARCPAGWSGIFAKLVKAASWHIGVLASLRGKKVACINCHSLAMLPVSVLIKWWKRSILIYDTHELETETRGLRGKAQTIARFLERLLIGQADTVCVVNESIARWYEYKYKLPKVWVVRNVPVRVELAPAPQALLRERIGLTSRIEGKLFIYQGLLAPGRGVEVLVEASQALPEHHLVFMGYGELEGRIRCASVTHSNIHFLPAVPPQEIRDYTAGADAGIALIENECLSYYLCLPNKLFEYAHSGIPSIASDFPEMRSFIRETGSGWTTAPDAASLKAPIQSLDEHEWESRRVSAVSCARKHGWQEEEPALLAMYRSLGFPLLVIGATSKAGSR